MPRAPVLQTCSLHDKFLCTQAQTIFFRTILIVKTALGAMFDIGWGSTKPLKGYPNYIIYPQGLAVIFSHHQVYIKKKGGHFLGGQK